MEVGLGNKTGVETLVNLSKPHQHVHKNFTVPGLFLNYVLGFMAFSVVSTCTHVVQTLDPPINEIQLVPQGSKKFVFG